MSYASMVNEQASYLCSASLPLAEPKNMFACLLASCKSYYLLNTSYEPGIVPKTYSK